MDAGVIDAAVVGGVDTLCLTTLYGFNSLQLLSPDPCRPYDADRDGISLGEAAVFFLLERPDAGAAPGAMALLGVGESCDAYHMSSPHPEGRGAHDAMRSALESAGLGAGDIDYVNLPGTGTPSNDAAEDHAVMSLLGAGVPVNSTKGMTGHALGAAGAAEALVAVLALEAQRIPASPGTRARDPKLRANYEVAGGARDLKRLLRNSFGLGGTNCSLVFGGLRDGA
jgi:3-oxoacyl-[acyl-carrier-protein] synthase-1